MAEVAALSLAANILQVLEYGKKFVTNAWTIYQSGADGVTILSDLELNLPQLKTVLQDLRAEPPIGLRHDDGVYTLARQCANVLQEMMDSLAKITSSRTGRKRQAVVTAFQLAWKQSDIKFLQDRLNQFRDDLNISIMVSLRTAARMTLDKQDEILNALEIIKNQSKGMEKQTTPDTHLTTGFGPAVRDFLIARLEHPQAETADLQQALAQAVHSNQESSKVPTSKINISESRRESLLKTFISHLSYPGMKDREYQIHQAYKETFRWAFNDNTDEKPSWSSLKQWLESDDQVYWITGKAGSGKSTLMRYISQSSDVDSKEPARCEKYLQQWAGNQAPVIMARFYFWAAGSKIQTSQIGLFRTLLHQILTVYPDPIPLISPKRWELLSLLDYASHEFTSEELQTMLYQAVEQVSRTSKLAIFVDGLDEFDGNPETLIQLLNRLSSKFPIKLCVASRPWTEFQNAFKRSPSLRLEHLTRWDIRHYVTTKFDENEYFNSLRQTDVQFADTILDSIVKKASGVFLWVTLTVNSLLSGLGHGDRMEDLSKRLALLPSDLESLYEGILNQIDTFYQEHAFQYFQLMRACSTPPSLLLFYFADQVNFTDFALDINMSASSKLPIENQKNKLDDMRRRLNSRCKGLLEVVSHPEDSSGDGTVQYLHRTVFDYIERPDVQEKLRTYCQTNYDPNIRILAANIVMAKLTWPNSPKRENASRIYNVIYASMNRAAKVDAAHRKDLIRLLDCLHGVLVVKNISLITLFQRDGIQSLLYNCTPQYDSQFLCFAVNTANVEYFKERASSGCAVSYYKSGDKVSPLRFLARKIRGGYIHNRLPLLFFVNPALENSPRMLEEIIRLGGDANARHYSSFTEGAHHHVFFREPFQSYSPWEVMLGQIIFLFGDKSPTLDESTRRSISNCVRIMIDHGAKVTLNAVRSGYSWLCEDDIGRRMREWLQSPQQVNFICDAMLTALTRMKEDRHTEFSIDICIK